MRQPSFRRQDFYSGFILERRKPKQNVKGKDQAGDTCKSITNVCLGGGLTRSSVEAAVMAVEQRG